jgi:hypothetical protein
MFAQTLARSRLRVISGVVETAAKSQWHERAMRVRAAFLAEGGLPLVWIALTAIALVPVWTQRLLPMLDTPSHLALARGWHSYHDAAYNIAKYYDLRIRPVPYIAFYAVIDALLYVCSIETANKLFLSAYLVLFPLSVLAIARALRRSPWLALGAFPLAFNQNWIYGFSSYLMSIALAFFSLAILIRFLEAPTRRRALALMVMCLLSYSFHILPWASFGMCAIALLYTRRRELRTITIAALAMAPSVLVAIFAIVNDRHEGVYMKAESSFSGTFSDFVASVKQWPGRVLELYPGKYDTVAFVVLAVTVFVLVKWRGVRGDDEGRSGRVLTLVLILLGLEYVSLPYSISKPLSWWYVAPRVPAMMAPFFLLLPAGRFDGWRRLAIAPFLFVAIMLPLKLSTLYRDFSRRNAGFMHLVDQIPTGANAFVVYRGMTRGKGSAEMSGDPATSAPVHWHYASWPMALHGGYGAHIFDQGVPIRPRAKDKLTAPSAAEADDFSFRKAPAFDYYIIRLAPDFFDREPSVKLVHRIGDWSLYERVHALTDEP